MRDDVFGKRIVWQTAREITHKSKEVLYAPLVVLLVALLVKLSNWSFVVLTLLFIFHQDTRHRSEADRRGRVRR